MADSSVFIHRKNLNINFFTLFPKDVGGRDNLAMQLRSTSSLRETSLARGRMYEHHFSMDGLENPWKEQVLHVNICLHQSPSQPLIGSPCNASPQSPNNGCEEYYCRRLHTYTFVRETI